MRRYLLFPALFGCVAIAIALGWLGLAAKLRARGASAVPFELCSNEEPFLAENQAAMNKMMDDMNIDPSGDIDRDFSTMMIPHHQGAIDMAQAELRHGQNEQLRRIAQEIIVEQQQEIVAMRLALNEPLPPSASAPDQPSDLTVSAAPVSGPVIVAPNITHRHKEP